MIVIGMQNVSRSGNRYLLKPDAPNTAEVRTVERKRRRGKMELEKSFQTLGTQATARPPDFINDRLLQGQSLYVA